ncbi:MAG: glycosyl transferase [Patescibacteria group bacterium]|nr:MAG: glycosyl transferase [Patescibacteria group bacterium]
MVEILVVVLNYNTKVLTEKCLKSIVDKKWKRKIKVVVVDNASTDGSLEYLKKKFKTVSFIVSKSNLGFAGGNNLALKRHFKDAEFCLILNSDTEVLEGSLDSLYDFAKSGFDIASPKLINKDGSFQPNGGELPYLWPLFLWLSGLDDIFRRFINIPSYQERSLSYYKKGRVGWVSGTAMLVKNEVFDRIGFFDDNIFMYGEDVDFCFRARKAGFKIGWTDSAEVIHLGGGSLDRPQFRQWLGEFKGLLYFYKKHFGKMAKVGLLILIYIFVFFRIIAFWFIGKKEYAKTYVKILREI